MKIKYSHAKREQYSRLLAALLCDQHFGARPTATLDGPAVLRFTPIRQVNLFVVQQLLGKWTAEMAKLRSPYFDFEDADVRQSLTQFMNVLSRRIKLSRPVFEPLLAQAISDTLIGALDPTETFGQKCLGEGGSFTPEQLREALRYLDINKGVFESFLDTLPATQLQERDYLASRFRLHQEKCAAELQPVLEILQQFNVLLPITEQDLSEETVPLKQPEAAAPLTKSLAPAPEPTPQAVVTAAAPSFTAPAPASPPVVAPAASALPNEPAPATQQQPLAEPTGAVPLYEKLKAEKAATAPSLSETLRQERAGSNLAEKAPKVESLREAISINQRFSFINELFNGENMEYHAAIQHLDALPDADAAKRYVTENLAAQYGWIRKEEHMNKLLKLIDRRFSN